MTHTPVDRTQLFTAVYSTITRYVPEFSKEHKKPNNN